MMRIEFYDANGVKKLVNELETEDYWEACEFGYAQLHKLEKIDDLDDFQVLPPEGWEDN